MFNLPRRYATLEEMQKMEFGVTGNVKYINEGATDECMFELLIGMDESDEDNWVELYGWAQRSNDANGDMVDWDRVSEEDAVRLGLIKR